MTTLHIDHLRYDDYDTLIILVMITNLVSPHLQARLLCFSPAVLESKAPPLPEKVYISIYDISYPPPPEKYELCVSYLSPPPEKPIT